MARPPGLVPDVGRAEVGAFRIHAHADVPPDAPWRAGLATLHEELRDALGVAPPPGALPVPVYVLKDREDFRQFLRMHRPGLPERRAFFLEEGGRGAIYVHESEHLLEDLRHEGTHALLRAAGLRPPAWLDEGLAECFEAGPGGLVPHPEHSQALSTEEGPDDWSDLDALGEEGPLAARDYRRAWARAHKALKDQTVRELLEQGRGRQMGPAPLL